MEWNLLLANFLDGDEAMKETYTAVVRQSGPWWIRWIKEIPGVNCQERTREELLVALKVTLQEALEFDDEK